MANVRYPGSICQVQRCHFEPVDAGTMISVPTSQPGLLLTEIKPAPFGLHFWQLPLHIARFEPTEEFLSFEQRVLDAHLARALIRKHHPDAPIPEGELDKVEGRFELRREAAKRCRDLLAKARADLASAQAQKTAEALAVKNFGLTSAYRSKAYDEALWRGYFRAKYYSINASRSGGFIHGTGPTNRLLDQIAEEFVDYISPRKAAPGFSNHTNGTAVDFYTVEHGKNYHAETGGKKEALAAINRAYEQTWLYHWLDTHQDNFKMERIKTEAWHWEFKGVLH